MSRPIWGRHFIEMLQNIFLQYISFSIPPQFFHIVNGSVIDICLQFTYPYHCYLHVKLFDGFISLHIDVFCYIFLSGNFWGNALLVTYISCKFCIFLRSTGKHCMCSAQKSDIVWCEIFKSYCYFNRHGYQNPTAVLPFLFYITLYRQLHTDADCIVYSIFFNIYFIFNCNCHSLYVLFLSIRYGSLQTTTGFLETFVLSPSVCS